jgi:aspartate/methionine/tyrosine aminotransferase
MKYSFDVNKTIPFLSFRALRSIAERSVGESNILDLSQGEPGYGFSPNVRSRRFLALLSILDIAFNNHNKETLFFTRKEYEIDEIEKIVDKTINENFSLNIIEILKNDWDFFIKSLEKICESQNLNLNRFDIYYELFKYSNLMGGRYPQPSGHILLKATMAEEYSKSLNINVKAHELISVMGASHGIGSVFKALGDEGINFLSEGDTVVMTSPVYSPYNAIFTERKINVISLPVDPETGTISDKDTKKIIKNKERIKAFILISPNNPTGFTSNKKLLSAITEIIESHNSLLISDEVYYRFFDNAKSICSCDKASRRLIRIDSLSKIERATGVRSGDIYISDRANEFITHEILPSYIPKKWENIRHLLNLAISPGGKNIGLFNHITGIPGPSVAISLAHVILGKEERSKYIELLKQKVDIFYKTLGIPFNGNGYYGMINLSKLESKESLSTPIEIVLEHIAEKGVVLMPANLFFSESDRNISDKSRIIRVSLPNLSFENTKKAAQIIKEVCNY